MKLPEILVTVVAFVAGYWLISVFLPLLGARRGEAERGPGPQREPGANEPAWFEVLEVDEQTSAEDIAAAYKRRISQYHPDKVQHLGPELVRLAEQHAKQINAAYETAMRRRGQG